MTSIDKPDYWALLGLTPGSNSDQLKRAFRREARKWHPDLNANDRKAEERFKLVNEAYAVLSDPRKKSHWENLTKSKNKYNDPFVNGFPNFNEYLDVVLGLQTDEIDNDVEEFSDNFSDDNISTTGVTSEWPTTSPAPPPPVQVFDDIETLVPISPEEALNGATIELELQDGTLVEVQTPPFAGDGWRLRLAGLARGGKDHFLQLRVQTHDGLRIDGLRVFYKLELLPHDAVLGCAVEVPTLDGQVTLQVPPLSSSGRLLRLRGRGLEYDGRSGDQFVEIQIVIPIDLSDAEDALYKRLQELSFEQDML